MIDRDDAMKRRSRSRLWRAFNLTFPIATAGVLALAPLARAAFRPPFIARRFVAATDHPDASRAAASVLRSGGNAADGAIAAALALGVVNPASSGFGGGGFATLCTPQGQCTFIDFREVAPAALTADAIRNAPDAAHASQIGGLAVGVPGEPAGLLDLSRRFGRISLSRTVAPAVALARQGFAVSDYLAERVAIDRERLANDGNLARLFLTDGAAVAAGVRVRRPRLAMALERYGSEGERFVHGAFAVAVADAVRAAGGVLTAEDIRAYRPQERPVLSRTFRGVTVITAPPPSAGGLILLEALAFIDGLPASQLTHGSSTYDHALAEAWRGAFDDRARYIGDPGAQTSPVVDALLAPARIAQRRNAFDPAHARPVVIIDPPHDHGTAHICVIDADGMMVSLTSTVNLSFGARISVPGMDVVLNDQIDDFSLGTAVTNNYGLAAGIPNALAAGRRPISSMTPTILLRDGHPFACIGASGGPRIATASTQALLNIVLHGMDPEAAVSSPRIHHQGTPDYMLVDRDVAEDVRAALRARGYDVREAERASPLAVVQAIVVRNRDGHREITAASDPRKGGLPAGE